MGNAVIGALRVVLGMDSAAFERGATASERRLAAMRRNMDRIGKSMQRVGARMSVAVTAPLVALATKSIAAQKEQEQAVAAVSAALASMGDSAGYTLEQLESMASALQAKSLYGDEEILRKVTANLLTFGNVQGEVFARAQQMAVDLSARLGQDLQSSAVMLGKALNDPVQGLTALSRVGVSFTEEQKEQIKAMAQAGNVAGAQAVMLAELERQYAGQAEALANTDSGRITQAWNAIGDAMERVGAIILPIVAEFADKVKSLAERFQNLSPETQRLVVVAGTVAAALGPAIAATGIFVAALAPLAGVVAAVLSPLGLLAVTAGATAVAIYTNWDGLKERFPAVTGAIETGLSNLNEAFWTQLDAMKQAGLEFVAALEAAFSGDLQGAISAVGRGFGAMRDGVVSVLDALLGQTDEKIIAWGQQIVVSLKERWNSAVAAVQDLRERMVAALREMLDVLWAEAVRIGEYVIDGIVTGLQAKWESLKSTVSDTGSAISGWFKERLGIQSPSRVFRGFGRNIIEGLVNGLTEGRSTVQGAMETISQAVEGVGEGMAGVGEAADGIGQKIGSMFGAFLRGAKSFKEMLAGIAQEIANLFLQQGIDALVSALSGAFGGGGGFLSGLFGSLFGFANGGEFNVGGVGGVDSQIVAFRATPNERVRVTTPHQEARMAQSGDSGALLVRVEANEFFDARVERISGQTSAEMVKAYDKQMPARHAQIRTDSRVRGR